MTIIIILLMVIIVTIDTQMIIMVNIKFIITIVFPPLHVHFETKKSMKTLAPR